MRINTLLCLFDREWGVCTVSVRTRRPTNNVLGGKGHAQSYVYKKELNMDLVSI